MPHKSALFPWATASNTRWSQKELLASINTYQYRVENVYVKILHYKTYVDICTLIQSICVLMYCRHPNEINVQKIINFSKVHFTLQQVLAFHNNLDQRNIVLIGLKTGSNAFIDLIIQTLLSI